MAPFRSLRHHKRNSEEFPRGSMVRKTVDRAPCPCCGKPTLQRYKLDSELALSLAFIEAVGGPGQSEVNFIAAAKAKDPARLCVKDYALLRFWGLIEKALRADGSP